MFLFMHLLVNLIYILLFVKLVNALISYIFLKSIIKYRNDKLKSLISTSLIPSQLGQTATPHPHETEQEHVAFLADFNIDTDFYANENEECMKGFNFTLF